MPTVPGFVLYKKGVWGIKKLCLWTGPNLGALNTMVTSELTGEVSMGVLLVFLVFWRRGRYIGPDQQGDRYILVKLTIHPTVRPAQKSCACG